MQPLTGWLHRDVRRASVPRCSKHDARKSKARIVLIGANDNAVPPLAASRLDWRENTEVGEIKGFDIGIMTLCNTRWERGKCGCKLIRYMACGKPVIASPVNVNRDSVEPGVNGFLAETPEEWDEAAMTRGQDEALRHSMGAAGRAKVGLEYSLAGILPRLAQALRTAANKAA